MWYAVASHLLEKRWLDFAVLHHMVKKRECDTNCTKNPIIWKFYQICTIKKTFHHFLFGNIIVTNTWPSTTHLYQGRGLNFARDTCSHYGIHDQFRLPPWPVRKFWNPIGCGVLGHYLAVTRKIRCLSGSRFSLNPRLTPRNGKNYSTPFWIRDALLIIRLSGAG